ncbi:hypothetical protein D3C81_1249800 [compost metagenome]
MAVAWVVVALVADSGQPIPNPQTEILQMEIQQMTKKQKKILAPTKMHLLLPTLLILPILNKMVLVMLNNKMVPMLLMPVMLNKVILVPAAIF